jgi:hypothetical protein
VAFPLNNALLGKIARYGYSENMREALGVSESDWESARNRILAWSDQEFLEAIKALEGSDLEECGA